LRRKSLYLFIFLPLVLIAVAGISATSLTAFARHRERQKMEARVQLERIRTLVERSRDLLVRHPDVELRQKRLYLASFSQLSEADQLRRSAELDLFARQLEETLLFEIAGIQPGDMSWPQISHFKTFSPNGFKLLYESLRLENGSQISSPPRVTGEAEADKRIVAMAEHRGYRLRFQADESKLISSGRHSLQSEAMSAWKRMQSAAREEGIDLELVSAYRSVARQRQIFLTAMRDEALAHAGREYTVTEIAAGAADAVVDSVLRYSSIPGFSKHHSGYTIDIGDPSGGLGFTEFEQTQGFQWISRHNYYNAKRFGFIPSYPQGADNQGPEPEPWEYVWVGERLLVYPTAD
jgi:D-alanyl-D-alanine carboxypeptidase